MSTLRAAVIGAGVFGGHHARKYLADPRVTLVSVFDVDGDRAAGLARELGVTAAASLEALLQSADIITVASPPVTHARAARAALEAGRHVLVEKPLAADIADAETLVALAESKKVVLACGHQERLVFEAMGLLAVPEKPSRIECARAGPWTGRSADVSVTLDLMVHDLDLALILMGGAPVRTSARGRRAKSGAADEITALLTFPNGARGEFHASRIATDRERTMHIVYPSGDVEIDFIKRTFVNKTPFALNSAFAETANGADPLGANVRRFVDAVVGAAPRPAVDGREGLAALTLARAIDRAASLPSLAQPDHDHASLH